MAGQYVLESFALTAKCPWMVRFRPTFRGMILDSGAYSVMSKGKTVDLEEYIDFALEHRAGYDRIVNLDVISGDVESRVDQGKKNLQRMRDAGLDPMPVFHQGEPWSVLEELASCGKVGLGFQRPIKCAEQFLDGCFSRMPANCRSHGFGMANERLVGTYPFWSEDAATWLHELLALMALSGQGSDVMKYLTPSEILALVLKKYERLHRATAWAGRQQRELDLFSCLTENDAA